MSYQWLSSQKGEIKLKEIRLQKYLADAGIASRRKAEELILQGKVKVNEKIVTELGTKVIPNLDKVEFNEKEVKLEESNIYILLNKPIRLCNNSKRPI